MFFNKIVYTVLLGIFIMLISSCSDLEPLFASIENEEKILTSNFPDQATILGMAVINNKYLVATGGALYYRDIDSDTWDTLNLPGNYEGVTKLVEITRGVKAYAVLVRKYYTSPDLYSLYELNSSGSVAGFSLIRSTPNYLDIFAQKGEDHVFAMTGNVGSWEYYKDYQSTTPTRLTVSRNVSGTMKTETVQSAIIVDVAKFGSTGNFYVATEYGLFTLSTSTTDTLTEVEVTTDPSVSSAGLFGYIGGIYYSPKYNRLYLSSGRFSGLESYIWTTQNPTNNTSWTKSSKQSNTFFTTFIEISQGGFEGILVGTRYFRPGGLGRDQGYRELPGGNVTSIQTPTGNKYTSGKLDTSAVIGFYVDGSTHFVFTSHLGLWRGSYGTTRNIDWFLE